MVGARAVLKSVIDLFPNADISVSIVWINILADDNEERAKESAGIFIPDPRIRHFYDPDKRSGIEIAQSLGGKKGAVAWDIYLFYKSGYEWLKNPPRPTNWVHQLKEDSWADPNFYYKGDDLADKLSDIMRSHRDKTQ